MKIFSLLFKLFTGVGVDIGSIGAQINRAIEIREHSKSEPARIEAEENIARMKTVRDIEVRRLEARENEVPDLFTQIIRLALASLVFLILLKMTADYISAGKIDPVPEQLWWFVGIVVAWCFWGKPWERRK